MKPSEILREAIRQIRKRGWYKGSLYQGDPCEGPVCVEGAIMAAISNNNSAELDEDGRGVRRTISSRIAHNALTETFGKPPYRFNDHPKTTRLMILRKMGQAARKLEAEGN